MPQIISAKNSFKDIHRIIDVYRQLRRQILSYESYTRKKST